MPGIFIAFEGGDGAGKSTQAQRLYDRFASIGRDAVLLREPGSTELGDYLRAYLVDGRPLTPPAELLLFEASRVELMNTVIAPKLDAGAVVIVDRFAASTVAYQGHGRDLDLGRIKWLNDFATGGRYPDLTVLLDIDPIDAQYRVRQRYAERGQNPEAIANRFEDEALRFHRRVRKGFIEQARLNPERWLQIDASLSADDVASAVWDAVARVDA